MGRPKDPNSFRSLAERYGVTAPTVKLWRDAGIDVTDPDAVAAFRAGNSGGGSDEEAETVTEARRRKLILEARLLEMKIAEAERRLIPVEEVNARDLRTGAVVKAMFMRIASDLPPMVVGLEVDEIEETLAEWAYARLSEVAGEDPAKFTES